MNETMQNYDKKEITMFYCKSTNFPLILHQLRKLEQIEENIKKKHRSAESKN